MKDLLKTRNDECDVEAVSITQYQWSIVKKDGSGVVREADQWYFDEQTCQADVEAYDVTAQQKVTFAFIFSLYHNLLF
jgi:hypothetical protein